jgi:hypothetical protein
MTGERNSQRSRNAAGIEFLCSYMADTTYREGFFTAIAVKSKQKQLF